MPLSASRTYCSIIAHRQFARDVRFVWGNAKLFNKPTSYIWRAADTLSSYFEWLYHDMVLEVSMGSILFLIPIANSRPLDTSAGRSVRRCHGSYMFPCTPHFEM